MTFSGECAHAKTGWGFINLNVQDRGYVQERDPGARAGNIVKLWIVRFHHKGIKRILPGQEITTQGRFNKKNRNPLKKYFF